MYRTVTSRAARQLVRPPTTTTTWIARRSVSTFDWKDPLGSNGLFTDEEIAIAETAEAYSQEKLLPRVLGVRTSYPNVD